MFERFCNKNYLNIHPFVNFFQLGYNYEKNNYYINKEEKIENFETINKSELIHKKYIKLLGNEKNYKQFLNYFNNNKIINIPFKNCFNSSDIIYQEPRLWEKISGSSGMAAGNTIEEALVQGISEIFEHYVQEQFFKNPPKKLYFISQTNINESNLNIMKNIEKNNNGIIKIADLSYEYSVPVCLAILYNYNTYNYIINFSAAPTIQIAIERALTELYQNKYNYKTFDIQPQRPYINSYEETLSNYYSKFSKCNQIPEFSLLNNEEKEYNKEIFLQDDNYTNQDFINYYQKLCQKLEMPLYYYDFSPLENIKAILIISPYKEYKNYIIKKFEKLSNYRKKRVINIANNIYNLISETLNGTINIAKIKYYRSILNKKNKMNELEQEFLGILLGTNWFIPYFTGESLAIIFELSKKEISKEYILYATQNTHFEFLARKYISIYEYKISKKYTNEEIYNFLSLMDNFITMEDVIMGDNLDYLFYKIVLEPMKYLYLSEPFQNMIQAYCITY